MLLINHLLLVEYILISSTQFSKPKISIRVSLALFFILSCLLKPVSLGAQSLWTYSCFSWPLENEASFTWVLLIGKVSIFHLLPGFPHYLLFLVSIAFLCCSTQFSTYFTRCLVLLVDVLHVLSCIPQLKHTLAESRIVQKHFCIQRQF